VLLSMFVRLTATEPIKSTPMCGQARRRSQMSIKNERALRAPQSYSVSLQQAAAAIWGDNFWGREKINPEPTRQLRR
jgi:hypothetical protein